MSIATPTYTRATAGNLVAYGSALAAGASSAGIAFSVGDSTGTPAAALGGSVQVGVQGGATVATTNGLAWAVYKAVDTAPNWSPTPYATGVTVTTVSGSLKVSVPLDLPIGYYLLIVTNLDTANAVTYGATLEVDVFVLV